ncbi:MAG: heme ABC transporter ATP-binding protein [Chloroflexota bacterium]
MYREHEPFHAGTYENAWEPMETFSPDLNRDDGRNNMLKVTGLSVRYGARVVLENISLNVAGGKMLALIGPNGTGKSTFIKAVSGVIPAQRGKIQVNGQDVTRLSPLQRARLMAVIPQAAALPPAFTVWQTVLMGRTPHLNFLGQPSQKDEEIARRSLERVNALDLAKRRVGELSGGEAQRILMARALAQSAPLLLMDEPTAHLDLKYQLNILSLASSLAHKDGFAVLIVLHDLNLAAQYADRVALLAEGRLQAIGTPEQTITSKLLVPAYDVPLHVLPHPIHGRPFVSAIETAEQYA